MMSEREAHIRECYDECLEAVPEDRDLWETALRQGCGEAGWHLYEVLREEDRFGHPWEPLDLLRQAAGAGSADAQCELGWQFYTHVTGLPREYEAGFCGDAVSGDEALHWMEEALPHRVDLAPYLAHLLLEGKGVPADEGRAVRALTAAVEGRYEEEWAYVEQCRCGRMLAKCYAEGRGVAKDRRKAAELYRQAQNSDYYLFDYYKDGNPRAAVRYWMRDMCFHLGLTLWVDILERVSAPEGCTRLRPEDLRRVWDRRRSGEEAFYALPGEPPAGRQGGQEDCYAPLGDLLDREMVRLFCDGALNGDGRCGDALKELLASGTATEELLEQLSPNSGVCDWPDAWYGEALERIEDRLAWEVRKRAEQCGDPGREEDAFDRLSGAPRRPLCRRAGPTE